MPEESRWRVQVHVVSYGGWVSFVEVLGVVFSDPVVVPSHYLPVELRRVGARGHARGNLAAERPEDVGLSHWEVSP